MLDLVLKDIRTTRIFWLPAVFCFLVFLLTSHESVLIYLLIGISFTFLLSLGILGIDDIFRTEALFASLPVTRSSIVFSRYLSWIFIIVITLALFLGSTAVFQALLAARAAQLGFFLTLKGLMSFVVPSILLASLYLPLYFRFGLGRSLQVFFPSLLVLGIALTGLAQVLGPYLIGTSETGIPKTGLVESPVVLLRLIRQADHSLGTGSLILVSGLALVLITWISARISIHFYRKRDL